MNYKSYPDKEIREILCEDNVLKKPFYNVLEKLVSGKHDESVIAIPKGRTLSIHEFDGLRPCTIKK